MSEQTGQGTSGETGHDQSTALGASTSTPPAGFVPQSALDDAEAKRRAMQSAMDRQKAEFDSFKAQMAAEFGELKQSVSQFDPNQLAATLHGAMAREAAMADARKTLAEKYPHARQEVLATNAQTPEELEQAVKASHETEEARVNEIRSAALNELRGEIKEKFGLDLQVPTTVPNDGAGDKAPAASDISRMTGKQLLDVSDAEFAAAIARAS